ncbi:hypothetical protein [Desulfosporosinus sp. Sb-LF]|uniref:hypothetical protein n=1 Tax=Desulfosporosinus sp. Sb-LF TaxID=2560027 RepID=UPI00107F02AB|nr:hypothetical protein [Desulfosporosinus sp. Sb-LF]TGE31547.1 hypothetical protein E4K68_16875 [Desulfosporosinus sp. Sb-LF]
MHNKTEETNTFYQPIISVAKKIIGIESLARGLDKLKGTVISPLESNKTEDFDDLLVEVVNKQENRVKH